MKILIIGVIAVLSLVRAAEALECEAILVDGIFRTDEITRNSEATDEFRRALCSASDRGSLRSSDFGMSIPVFGDALRSIGFNASQNSLRQWQQQNCSQEERNTTSASSYSRLIRRADQGLVSAWQNCIDRQSLLDSTGLVCRFDEVDGTDGSTFEFYATWAASDMTNAGTVPKISTFDAGNLECRPDLTGRDIGPGGLATICSRPARNRPATLVLELDIGGAPCVRSIPAVVTLSGRFAALEEKRAAGAVLRPADQKALDCLSGGRNRANQKAEAQRKFALMDICEQHALAGEEEKAMVCINALAGTSKQSFGQRVLQYRVEWSQQIAMGERMLIGGYPSEAMPISNLDASPEEICGKLLSN